MSDKESKRNVTRSDVICNVYGLPVEIKVNDKQFRFCQLYIQTLNATDSYQEVYGCGYNTAKAECCRLLANPNVKECIKWLIESNADCIDIEKGEIMSGIKEIAIDKNITPSTRLKALQLLSNIKGMTNEDKTQINATINVTIDDKDPFEPIEVDYDEID